jgi:hypothetical protein
LEDFVIQILLKTCHQPVHNEPQPEQRAGIKLSNQV